MLSQVRDGQLADTTANNKISNVVRYYRWLIDDYGYSFCHRPFNNDSLLISYVKQSGNIGHKLTQSHNARIKTVPKATLPSEEVIVDDGRLRPLPEDEQEIFLQALDESKNTEMALICLFALTTGARIQSILTLRHKHFRAGTGDAKAVPLAIGHGTLIDSKYSKKQTLMVPAFMQQKLAIYSQSDRAMSRFLRYCEKRHFNRSEQAMDDCYLFLSSQGHPLYDAKSDLFKADDSQRRTNPRLGDSVRKFITNRILSTMKERFGRDFHLQFHDLRATYGMNLVDTCSELVNAGTMKQSELLPFIQSRMNHADSKTTEGYLRFREKNKLVSDIISKHQRGRLARIERLMRGRLIVNQ